MTMKRLLASFLIGSTIGYFAALRNKGRRPFRNSRLGTEFEKLDQALTSAITELLELPKKI